MLADAQFKERHPGIHALLKLIEAKPYESMETSVPMCAINHNKLSAATGRVVNVEHAFAASTHPPAGRLKTVKIPWNWYTQFRGLKPVSWMDICGPRYSPKGACKRRLRSEYRRYKRGWR